MLSYLVFQNEKAKIGENKKYFSVLSYKSSHNPSELTLNKLLLSATEQMQTGAFRKTTNTNLFITSTNVECKTIQSTTDASEMSAGEITRLFFI